jgi:hypothetical protein
MRQRLVRCFTASLLAAAVACGGSEQRPPAPGAIAPIATGAVDDGPPPDLSPVAAPPDLFGVGRISRPAHLLDTLVGWAKLPIDWRRELASEAPGFDNVIDLNAPIDVAMALPRAARPQDLDDPRVVVSFGLRSIPAALEFAKRRSGRVERVAPGTYRVGGSDDCVVAASAGSAPARLVCGDRPEDIEALLAYVTRGLPRESFGPADVHFELRADPIRRRFGRELRTLKLGLPFFLKSFALDVPRVDRAVAEGAYALADELVALIEDTDRAVFEVSVRPDAGSLESLFDVRFTGKSSWTVQTLAEAGQRAATPPESFWRLPKDASGASYSVPSNAQRYAGMRRVIAELADGLLEHERVPRRVRDQLAAIIEDTATSQATVVYARGDVPAPGAADTKVGSADRGALARDQITRSLGWYIVGIDDKADRYKTYLNRIVAVYNDRELRRLLEKRAEIKPNKLPTLRARAARGKGLAPGSSAFELVLPPTLFDDYLDVPPAPVRPGQPRAKAPPRPPPGKSVTVVLIVVPDGARTWIGLSADEKALVEKLGVVLQGNAAATLASRDGLASLRNARAVSGGFWSLSSITSSLDSPLASVSSQSQGAEFRRRLNALPHHGDTPMPYTLTATPAAITNVAWSLSVPRAVAEDVGALIPLMGMGPHSHGTPPPPLAVPPPAKP